MDLNNLGINTILYYMGSCTYPI